MDLDVQGDNTYTFNAVTENDEIIQQTVNIDDTYRKNIFKMEVGKIYK